MVLCGQMSPGRHMNAVARLTRSPDEPGRKMSERKMSEAK